ncbi:MAG: hypothetical protein Q7J07_07610 [Pelolinea sp.]|nr:hypothetical protein [Pelolinea sp.]
MCCVISTLFFLGPRAGLLIWWLLNPSRFSLVYNNLLMPIIGMIFLPATTLTYTFIYKPSFGGLDWVWIIIALMVDLSLYGGGIFSKRR